LLAQGPKTCKSGLREYELHFNKIEEILKAKGHVGSQDIVQTHRHGVTQKLHI